MKKVILFILVFFSLRISGEVTQSVVFNFNFTKDYDAGDIKFTPAFSQSEWTNGFFGQLALTNRIASVDGHPIEIEFKRGTGVGGVVINYTKFNDEALQNQNFHALQTRTNSLVTVRNTSGCELDSIRFYGAMGSLAGPSTGDLLRNLWVAKTSTDTVQFINQGNDSGNTSMVVYYKYPSKPLNFYSSKPGNGENVESFSSMTLNFNMSIAKYITGGITLNGADIDSPVELTPSVSGSSVTLKANQTYTTYGDYTVYVPAGMFKNSEGGSNEALSITFKVNPKRDIITSTDVEPAEGTYNQLPESIVLRFGDYVSVPDGAKATFYLNGESKFTAPVVLNEDNTKSVSIAHGRGAVTDEGTWEVVLSEKSVYNGLMGDEAAERWNPEIILTYTIESAELQELKAAKALKTTADKNLIGYPSSSSAGYQALKSAVEKENEATIEELKEAMGLYYKETDVNMPEDGKWYRIANVNADGTMVYLTYDNQTFSLKTSYTCRDAYKLKVGNGVMEFQTKDEHYLTVPGNPSGFEGFVYNKSGKASQLTIAKLQVNDADSTILLGKFSITGWLGRNADDEDMGNSTAAIEYPSYTVVTSPTSETFFSSTRSSGFVFIEASEPCDNTPVNAVVEFDSDKPNGIILDKAGDPATLRVLNVSSADIADASLPYYMKQNPISATEEEVIFTNDILTKVENSANYFTVNTSGLEAGEYLLYIPEGTFTYVPRNDDETVTGQLVRLSVTISEGDNNGGSTTDSQTKTPVIQFANGTSTLSIANGSSEIIIEVLNADVPVVYNQYLPYLTLSGTTSKISATLTKLATSSNQFYVTATGLAAGEYALVIPSGTFKDASGNSIDVEGNLNLTILNGPTFEYTYAYTVDPKVLLNPNVFRTVIAEVELNDLIIYTSEKSIVPNPNAILKITNLAGATVKTGHLVAYPNFLKEITYDYIKGMKALKLVLDQPFTADELKYSPGTYFLEIPAAAFGDANYGQYLNGKSVSGICKVNKESKTYFNWAVNDNVLTGIEEISSSESRENQVIYDLSGRKINKPVKKGVYIINGRKVLK